MGRRQRRGVDNTEAVQPQTQLREIVDKGEGLGLKTLVALVVTHPSSRPVGGDDLGRTKMALRKSRLAAGRRSAKQNNGWADQSHSLVLALKCCRFLGHSSHDGNFQISGAFCTPIRRKSGTRERNASLTFKLDTSPRGMVALLRGETCWHACRITFPNRPSIRAARAKHVLRRDRRACGE